ncbi:MAG: hypothetical protein ACXQTL_05520 [Methanosarcinales archaeon]
MTTSGQIEERKQNALMASFMDGEMDASGLTFVKDGVMLHRRFTDSTDLMATVWEKLDAAPSIHFDESMKEMRWYCQFKADLEYEWKPTMKEAIASSTCMMIDELGDEWRS